MIADVRKELMGHSHGGDVHSLYTHVELPRCGTPSRVSKPGTRPNSSSLTTGSHTQGDALRWLTHMQLHPAEEALPPSGRSSQAVGGVASNINLVARRPHRRDRPARPSRPASVSLVTSETRIQRDAQNLAAFSGLPRQE